MDGDKFISTKKDVFRNQNINDDENNFFMQNEISPIAKLPQFESGRHINDYDFNILREDAYKDVNDEVFKLEYKIAKIENELNEVNKQIQMAYEIRDSFSSEQLITRKNQLTQELSDLTELYKEASLSAKISGGLTSKIRDRFVAAAESISNFVLFLLSKLPGKISSVIEVRQSLTKLENINKSVDELMKSRYPYGEASEKYEQLSKYIARANSIQSEIYSFMK